MNLKEVTRIIASIMAKYRLAILSGSKSNTDLLHE